MLSDFCFKYKDYEIRSCPKQLAKLHPDDKNETIELVKWQDSSVGKSCFTVAYFVRGSEGYELTFVNDRPFRHIEPEDLKIVWEFLRVSQKILNEFFAEEYV